MVTETNTLGDVLLAEVLPAWTRQISTLADLAGVDVPVGTVLAKVTGKYYPVDFAGSAGAEVAVAVLAEDKLAHNDDGDAVVIARGAVVNATGLVWPAGATSPNKATGTAALEAVGILVRTAL